MLSYYARNKEKCRIRMRATYRARKAWISALKTDLGCTLCGYNGHPAALHFHHRPGTKKEFNIGSMWHCSKEKVLKEAAKCDVVCANCHAEITWKDPADV